MQEAYAKIIEQLEKKRLERVEQLRLSCTKSMELVNKIKLEDIEEVIQMVKDTAEELDKEAGMQEI